MALPQMTPEQRAAALEKARVTREKRKNAMEDLAKGKITPKAFMDKKDPVYSRVKAATFLKKLPGIGAVKAAKMMEECNINEDRRLGGLGDKQKAALLACIEKHMK